MKIRSRALIVALALMLGGIGAFAQDNAAPAAQPTAITPAHVQRACMHGLRGCWQATQKAEQQAVAQTPALASAPAPTSYVSAKLDIETAQALLVALNYALGTPGGNGGSGKVTVQADNESARRLLAALTAALNIELAEDK